MSNEELEARLRRRQDREAQKAREAGLLSNEEHNGCDTGVTGSPQFDKDHLPVAMLPGFPQSYAGRVQKFQDADFSTHLEVQRMWDNPLEFALFGLARQNQWPNWVMAEWRYPVLDLGPGNKLIPGAIRCEYPEYNFESPAFGPFRPTASGYQGPGDKNLAKQWADLLDREDGTVSESYKMDGVSSFRCYLPWESDSVGGIYAVNILEHLWDPRPIMEECARVLAPGCPLNIVVPHGSHGIYLQDIDHKKPFILDSWKNWLDNQYWGEQRRMERLKLRIGANFKFGIKEENVNICTQLIKTNG